MVFRIIRLLITAILQLTIMRKFEILIGWGRLAIVYMCSGIGGYLASATFEPYMVSYFFIHCNALFKPEIGPAGSQGGVMGGLFVIVIYDWWVFLEITSINFRNLLEDPVRVLSIHIVIAIFLLFTGFLPFIDNWAHIFGFIFGLLWAAGKLNGRSINSL